MAVYPPAPNAWSGGVTAAQALAFLKSPHQLAARFAQILSDRNFLSHYVLSGRYPMEGGALIYYADEKIESAEGPEVVTPGANYPLVTLDEDSLTLVNAIKRGFGHEVTDESVGRRKINPVERAIQLLSNKMVSTFDRLAMSLVQSAVTKQITGTGSWVAAGAGGKNMITAVEQAKAQIKAEQKGYEANAIVLTGTQWAKAAPHLLPLLPREAGNPVVAGAWPNVLGLDWVYSDDLPAGWDPTVIDTRTLGGIGHEDIPSPEYVALSVINEANGSGVEVARFREKNDSTLIQIRKPDVPVVENPNAAREITGHAL
jgi:hypothetical protein